MSDRPGTIAAAALAQTVTVALACYNQAHFLGEAIASVLAQTRPADRILVVDDGSTDATAQVAGRYPGVGYHHQANAGLSEARNSGLALADTRFILFLDADDVLLPLALEHALARFAQCPDIAFAYGGYRDVTVMRTPIRERAAIEHADGYRALLHDNHISMHGTVLYDAAKLRAVGGFDPVLRSCEDYDVYLKLARRHAIAAYGGIAAEYRRHPGGMSTRAARMSRIVRTVLLRQIDAGLTPEQRGAARRGLAFNRRHYSLQLIAEIGRTPTAALPLVVAGMREDPAFVPRLALTAVRAALRKVRAGTP